jgi:hypothetical protein
MQLIDTRFGLNTTVEVCFERYQNGQIAIQLIEAETGEPWTTATSALESPVPKGQVAIKNWSENEGIDTLLLNAGVIEGAPVARARSGFVSVPLYQLSKSALELINA